MNNITRAIYEGNFTEKVYQAIRTKVINCFNGNYRKRLQKKIDTLISTIAIKRMSKKFPIVNNKILFMTTRGSFNCNPRAIAEEIISQKLPWELVWVARKENLDNVEQYPKELKVVLRGSYEFYEAAASSRIWIDNSVSLSYLNTWKKEGQVLFETWHGSIGLKRFETNSDKNWIKKATHCGNRTDYCISNSKFETELYNNTFWSNAHILEYGHPRNDLLVLSTPQKKDLMDKKIREELCLPEGVKLALYAPTFRDNRSLTPYRLDYAKLKRVLEKKFGGEWYILTRFHFEVRKKVKKAKIVFPEFVVDATNYEDIQDLLLVSDLGITDYSSWICDFVLTKRPAFFFVTDLDEYYSERGFYYPLETTPFPIAKDNNELINNIINFDIENYELKCREFIADKGCVDDGYASKRVVEKIKEIIGG